MCYSQTQRGKVREVNFPEICIEMMLKLVKAKYIDFEYNFGELSV